MNVYIIVTLLIFAPIVLFGIFISIIYCFCKENEETDIV